MFLTPGIGRATRQETDKLNGVQPLHARATATVT